MAAVHRNLVATKGSLYLHEVASIHTSKLQHEINASDIH